MKPTFKEAFLFWLKLGFISFGGPAGQISIMHEFLVEKKKWIAEEKFMHALNYCMILPGPEAQQLATYIGWLLHGVPGGLVAGSLFVLPSVFILLGLSMLYVSFGKILWVSALFGGLKPAVIAIILVSLFRISKKSLLSPVHYLLALTSFICIFFLNVLFPLIITGALATGILAAFIKKTPAPGGTPEKLPSEAVYCPRNDHEVPGTRVRIRTLMLYLPATLLLWVIPFGIFYLTLPDFPFWKQLNIFFTQAALVTFGGAYAVLPYVAQFAVEKLHWLSHLEMIDGLALGESTPGPLIMVLTFVGFMAAYHHYDASPGMGAIGLLTTTFYTFLPCFFFIFAGAPVIEKTQSNPNIKIALSYVTAAIVGVMLNLTFYLGKAVLFSGPVSLYHINYFHLCWSMLSFAALYRFKINMILWIVISALAGLLYFLVQN